MCNGVLAHSPGGSENTVHTWFSTRIPEPRRLPLTSVLSSRQSSPQLLSLCDCFRAGFWSVFKRAGLSNPVVCNHGKFLFSNLTRLEDLMLYFIVQHKKNTSGTEMSFIPLPMYLMLYSLGHYLFARGLFNHCLTISKWEKKKKSRWVSSKGREELCKVLYLILLKSKQLYPFNISHACWIERGVKALGRRARRFSVACNCELIIRSRD